MVSVDKLLCVFINFISPCAANDTTNNEIDSLSRSDQLRLKVLLFFKCLEENGVLDKVVLVNDKSNGVHLMKTVDFDTSQNATDSTYAKIMKCREDYLDRMPLTISPVGDSYASVNALSADTDVYEAVARKNVSDGRSSSFFGVADRMGTFATVAVLGGSKFKRMSSKPA